MNLEHQKIKIDINSLHAPSIRLIENVNDTAIRYAEVEFYSNSINFPIPDSATANATFVTDGILISDEVSCEIANGNVIVPIDNSQIITRSGIMLVEVTIKDELGETSTILNTPHAFKVRVTQSIKDNAQITDKSLGTTAEILKEVALARGNFKNLDERFNNKLDNKDGTITESKLAVELSDKINSKAEKSTTLAGYGITNAYTRIETDIRLSGKLDDVKESVKTSNLADNSVTSAKIASQTVNTIHLANDAVGTLQIADGAVTTDKIEFGAVGEEELSTELQEKINEKLDGEVGIGTLFPYESQTSKINSVNFDYQKVGSWVDLQVYVDFKAFEPNNGESLTISGLPYVCKNSVNPRELCVSSNKNQMIWAIQKNSATLTLILTNTTAIVENEKLSFSIRYKIT